MLDLFLLRPVSHLVLAPLHLLATRLTSPCAVCQANLWNSLLSYCGLMASWHTVGSRKCERFAAFTELMDGRACILAQETHGQSADLKALRADFPLHHIRASFAASPAEGGLLFAFPPSFQGETELFEVVPGRIAAVRVYSSLFDYIVVNVHLVPGLPITGLRAQLRRLHRTLQAFPTLPVFLGGDVNFVDPDEGRTRTSDGQTHSARNML